MKRPSSPFLAVLLVTLNVTASPGLSAPNEVRPLAVSPGSATGTLVEPRCPSFSWSLIDEARFYELVVYRLGEEPEDAALVLRQQFRGSVAGWTPSLDRCLDRGTRYAWSVRAGVAGEETSWSPPAFFEVAPAPRRDELERALAVLRDHLPVLRDHLRTRPGALEQIDSETETPVETPLPPGEAAGSSEEVPKASTTVTTPTQLVVDGRIVATTFSGDGSELTALDPAQLSAGTAAIDISGSSASAATASGLSCSGCLTAAEIGASAVGSDEIVDGSIGLGDLAVDPATQSELDAHATDSDAHHPATTDTTCNGAACDGGLFTNLQWSSLVNRPAGLDDGDDDTTYAAGPGLSLNGTTFSLSGGPALAPMDNAISTVETGTGNGQHTSIIIGADGLPVISYYDEDNDDLKVAKCNDPACSGGDETLSIVDGAESVGAYNSMVLGADGLPVISYYDQTSSRLKVAKCNDPACAGGDETLSIVDDPANDVGQYSSITLGTDGYPVISYYDGTATRLKVAKCDDHACAGSNETLTTLPAPGPSGLHTSITLSSVGLPIISHFGVDALSQPAVLTSLCINTSCTNAAFAVADSASADSGHTSIALGRNGLPLISYYDTGDGLKVIACEDVACSSSTSSIVISEGDSGLYSSITVLEGLPIISHYDAFFDRLVVTRCNDAICEGGDESTSVVDDPIGGDDVGLFSSVTIGADGLPIISYHDATNGGLKVARCGSAFCVPYLRR